MDTLRVGVMGLGALGESHVQAYLGLPYVEVVAVASRATERARSVAVRYGIARWYEGYDGLIADPGVDAVSVTTEESSRRDMVLAALAAGKHVLVEAPLATALEDAREMARAAERSTGILMPGHMLRFEVRYARLKVAVTAGELGRLVALSARRNRPRSLIARYGQVHPAVATAIHDLDLMLWLTAAPLLRVRAIDRLARRDDGAHGVWALLEFANGVIGTLESSWMLPERTETATDDAFEAIGTEGTGRIQLADQGLALSGPEGVHLLDVSYAPHLHGVLTGALREELAHFASCARAGTRPTIVTPRDAVSALSAALALIESAQRGIEVTLSAEAGR